ncbi:glycoside hydrolase family 3 N-terminal domain-containing protein [Oceanithermus sp.]|uniref:glycoside hydrolase family 3 protein n=1 Tax=Oceanithermus sp. TaxID=2268145 RepID=UPI0025ECFAAC|nr:glycoside hydrolase family 3 N-terminal domain-containing protein [Oceanithermus sp.]
MRRLATALLLTMGLALAGAGDFMVLSFSGTEPPDALIERYHPAGVILFPSNLADDPVGLVRTLRTRYPDLLVFIDQEGGPFYTYRAPGVPRFPSAMALAASGDADLVRAVGRAIGQEIAYLGANVDLAPVLDVNVNPENPIIGLRSFGADPQAVARYGLAFARGLEEAGVLWTAKHFPGHGDTQTDSHTGLPIVDKPRAEIERVELAPFRAAVDADVPVIMTAHILYPALDPDYPATLSRKILTGLLRDEMGYQNLIITDDMGMRAISNRWGAGEAAVRAVEAGADLVLVGRGGGTAEEVYAALDAALASGRIAPDRVEATRARLARARARVRPPAPEPDWTALEALNLEAARAGVTWLSGELPIPGTGTLVIGPEISARWGAEPSLAELAPKYLPGAHYQVVGEVPSGDDITTAVERARKFDRVVLGTYHWLGRLPEEQVWLYQALVNTGKPVYVVALGNPDDYTYLDPAPAGYLVTYGYRAAQVRAALEALAGVYTPGGKLPVPVGPFPAGSGLGR